MACHIERSRVVAHRVAGARSPKTSPKKVRYGRQGLHAGPGLVEWVGRPYLAKEEPSSVKDRKEGSVLPH